jgi:tetratricopeptide (TPR) repeat protein
MTGKLIKILIILLIAVSSKTAAAQDNNNQLWDKANAAYLSQNYQEAVDGYEQILRTGHESAKLYFNLGNTYYKTGQTNLAILYLERAKLLDPNNKDIDFNIAFVNQNVVTKLEPLPQPFFVRWRASILNMHSTDTWATISIASFILFLLLAGFFIFSKIVLVRRISFISGIVILVLSIFTFSFASKQQKKIIQRNSAIVFCPRVTVKSAPSATSTDLFLIYEGVKVEVTDSVNTWKEIKLADGNEGWLPDSCIVKI